MSEKLENQENQENQKNQENKENQKNQENKENQENQGKLANLENLALRNETRSFPFTTKNILCGVGAEQDQACYVSFHIFLENG